MKKFTTGIIAIIVGLLLFGAGAYASGQFIEWAARPEFEQAMENLNAVGGRMSEIKGTNKDLKIENEELTTDKEDLQTEISLLKSEKEQLATDLIADRENLEMELNQKITNLMDEKKELQDSEKNLAS